MSQKTKKELMIKIARKEIEYCNLFIEALETNDTLKRMVLWAMMSSLQIEIKELENEKDKSNKC